jgi:Domain of unknown function (DUF4342)
MTERTCWETFKAESGNAFQRLKQLIHEGNVRRVRIRQGSRIVAEFPLTAGVVGAVIAPTLAAIGALVALIKDCSIDVERAESSVAPDVPRAVNEWTRP